MIFNVNTIRIRKNLTNLAREYFSNIFWPDMKSELCIPALGGGDSEQCHQMSQEINTKVSHDIFPILEKDFCLLHCLLDAILKFQMQNYPFIRRFY